MRVDMGWMHGALVCSAGLEWPLSLQRACAEQFDSYERPVLIDTCGVTEAAAVLVIGSVAPCRKNFWELWVAEYCAVFLDGFLQSCLLCAGEVMEWNFVLPDCIASSAEKKGSKGSIFLALKMGVG